MINVEELKKYDDRQFVEQAYMSILNRIGDDNGIKASLDSMSQGASKDDIIFSLRMSPEGINVNNDIYGLALPQIDAKRLLQYNDEQFIDVVYIAVLGRTADAEGKSCYLSSLRSGEKSKEEILHTIVNSDEARKVQVAVPGEKKLYRKRMMKKKLLDFPVIGRTAKLVWSLIHINRILNDRIASVNNKIEALNAKTEGISVQRLEDDEGVLRNLMERTGRVEGTARDNRDRLDKTDSLRDEVNEIRLEIVKNDIMRKYVKSADISMQYKTFEDNMRGNRKEIKERLTVYDDVVKNVISNNGNDIFALDLGCGRGEWLELMVEANIASMGVDSNYSMIEECHRKGMNVIKSDIVSYLKNAAANSADIITLFQVVEHLPAEMLSTVMREAYRVCCKGGVIIIETPNPENIIIGSCNFYFDPTHIKPIPPVLLSLFAESSGFTDIEITRLHPYGAIETDEVGNITPEQIAIKPIAGFFNNYSDYAVIAYKK